MLPAFVASSWVTMEPSNSAYNKTELSSAPPVKKYFRATACKKPGGVNRRARLCLSAPKLGGHSFERSKYGREHNRGVFRIEHLISAIIFIANVPITVTELR
jgi:hypothetical protein